MDFRGRDLCAPPPNVISDDDTAYYIPQSFVSPIIYVNNDIPEGK